MRQNIKTSDIVPLPIEITIPILSQIRAYTDTINQGQTPMRPVMLAKCNNTLYCVDGLDTLEAYRAANVPKISCIVVTAKSVSQALLFHVGISRRQPTNPFMVLDAMQWARDHGTDPIPDTQHAKLSKLSFGDDIKKTYNTWMGRLAKKLDVMPPFWHIFEPLSEIKPKDQRKALDSVMAFVHTTGTSPDASSLRAILRQFAPVQDGTADHVAGIESDEKAVPPQSIPVSGNKPLPDTNRISCSCGRQWYVDVKNKSVRRIKDSENLTILTDTGEPVYAVPPEMAAHLDMGGAPIHHYIIPDTFPAVLVSKKPLQSDMIQRVSHALKDQHIK